jgi:hypothetical protein
MAMEAISHAQWQRTTKLWATMEVELRFKRRPHPGQPYGRGTSSAATHTWTKISTFTFAQSRTYTAYIPSSWSINTRYLLALSPLLPFSNHLMTSLPHRATRAMSDSDSASDVASSAGSIMEDVSEPDVTNFKCLFCDSECPSIDKMFSHCDSTHKFPIRETIKDIGSSNAFLCFC